MQDQNYNSYNSKIAAEFSLYVLDIDVDFVYLGTQLSVYGRFKETLSKTG